MSGVELLMYSTDHCSLCDEALDLLASMPELGGLTLDVVDISQDEVLVCRHGADLPVLALKRETGVIAGTLNWPFDSGLILRWLSELE